MSNRKGMMADTTTNSKTILRVFLRSFLKEGRIM
jgi:hypothetical protein